MKNGNTNKNTAGVVQMPVRKKTVASSSQTTKTRQIKFEAQGSKLLDGLINGTIDPESGRPAAAVFGGLVESTGNDVKQMAIDQRRLRLSARVAANDMDKLGLKGCLGETVVKTDKALKTGNAAPLKKFLAMKAEAAVTA